MSLPMWFSTLARKGSAALVRNRHHLPRMVNRLIDDVANNPDGLISRLASAALGGRNPALVPPATSIPGAEIRVYIGPTNYAGQGFQWARALELNDARVGARNMAVELPGGFAFAADTVVPIAVYNSSTAWQRAEFEAARRFSHVLFEAERPLFGRLYGRSVARETDALQARGISCAFMCHGTDVRSPRTHARRNKWSPFAEDNARTRLLQADVDANLALLSALGLPVFVSTPDLLIDVPSAHWCPVVVDGQRWAGGRQLFSKRKPVVCHIPSMNWMKGTQLIEPVLRRLHESGVIEYRSVTGIPASRMPALIGDADIVLDQFRLGSYGVAACEAMAAGRLVIGHIQPDVRRRVREHAGIGLPIIEADANSLEYVILGVIASRQEAFEVADAGRSFVNVVHSGGMSATALRDAWINRG